MQAAKNGKRALLIISDGGDNSSRYNEKDIKRVLRDKNTQLYSIGIFDPFEYRSRTLEELNGPTLLSELTELTGGRSFTVENLSDLPDIAAKISAELRNQYVLGYRPTTSARCPLAEDQGQVAHTQRTSSFDCLRKDRLLRAQPLAVVDPWLCLFGIGEKRKEAL